MLTEAEIIKKLKKNPDWEPNENVTDDEWELFEQVKEKLDLDADDDDDPEWPHDSDEY